MPRIVYSILLVTLFALAFSPCQGHACPNCREAVSTGSVEEEADRVQESTAWNQNILMMIAMPYCLVGVLGFMIYRNLRVKGPCSTPTITEEEVSPV